MKNIIKQLLMLVKDSIGFVVFLVKVIYNRNFKNTLHKGKNDTAVVLANGPSLKNEIANWNSSKEFKNVDFIVLNYFAFEKAFFQIKPNHYCFADPMFFQDSHRREDARRLFDLLEQKVNWTLNVYIPSYRFKDFINYSKLTNSKINFIRVNTTEYKGFEKMRNYFYKKGLAMPIPQTVANLAIFVALNSSYKIINLYGVDHTFFDSLCVNDANQLCNKDKHFYKEEGQVLLKPIRRNDNGELFKISEYLYAIMLMFQSHDYLALYAKYLKVKILNCTQCSMIDSYEKKCK